MLKVVFIDDGIDPGFVPENIPFKSYESNEAGVKESTAGCGLSHGTQCYQIFRDKVRSPYRLISIKVLDSMTGTGTKSALIAALKWCANQEIDLINMSMGTRQFLDFAPIAEAVQELSFAVIVAACSNQNELTFPACLRQVIGVRHCSRRQA